jgi:two-component system CAI-1 autoinducer sensor kinase/phosphatase CqsS
MISGVKPFFVFKFIPDVTIFYSLYYIYTIFFMIYGHLLLYKSIKFNYKNKFIFYGCIVGWLGGLTTLLPYLSIPSYPFLNILVSIYTTFVTYALIKHRIFENSILIIKILSKFFSIIILVISYLFSLHIFHLLKLNNQNFEIIFSLIYLVSSFELYVILCKKFDSIFESKTTLRSYKKENLRYYINKKFLDVIKLSNLFNHTKYLIKSKMGITINSFYISNYLYESDNSNKKSFIKYYGHDIKNEHLSQLNQILEDHKVILSIKYDEVQQDFKDFLDSNNYSKGFIPLIYGSRIMGFITLKSRPNKNSYFYYNDMELFDNLAHKSGIALERIRLHLKFLKEAASIAHEIRNPIGAIKLATENLEQNPNQDQTINFKRQINKTIDLADNIIDMNLHELAGKQFNKDDFSYYSAYKAIIDSIIIYGYESNEEKDKVIIDLNSRKINAKEAEKEVIAIDDIDKNNNFILHIEDTAFKYIIFNLVKNALFYLKTYPDSKITIDFEPNKSIDSDLIEKFKLNSDILEYNVINVTDTGPGIANDIITKIFDSYFTSGKKGGTGVGLYFCQKVMNDFDGAIICQSEVGKYTTFSLLFPTLSKENQEKGKKEIKELEIKKQQALEVGMTLEEAKKSVEKKPIKNILLIDDVKLNIEILSKDLKEKCTNFNITVINDSVEAFELIKSKTAENKQFDLILTDIEMPDINGIELTSKIRNELNLSKDDIPILVYSSREKQEIIDEALKAGVNNYYTKPKDLRFIARNISKWILNNYIPRKNINHEEIIISENTLKDKNIIIADDVLVNLITIARQFEKKGANVTKCKDGKDIIDLVQKDPTKYHLILTDINMKEISGIEATKEVIKIQKSHNITNKINYRTPIIAISGDNHKDLVMKMLNSGIDDYVTKGSNGDNMIILSRFWIDYYHPSKMENSSKNKQNITKITDENVLLKDNFMDLLPTKEEMSEIIDAFESESQQIMIEIKEGKNNKKSLEMAIHKLKGASGSIGANRLFLYLSELNDILRSGKIIEDENFDNKLNKLLQNSITAMKNKFYK